MAAFVTILSASSWIFSKKLNIKNNIVTSNPLMKRKLGLIDASSSQRCCDITVLFVSELSSYSGTSQWSHPALSHQRGYQKIQLQTHSMYIHTHTRSDQAAFTFSLLVGSILSLTHREVATYSPTGSNSPNISVQQSIQRLLTNYYQLLSPKPTLSSFLFTKRKRLTR